MANLPLTRTYTADIYQLERTDPVDAGIGGSGIDNLQAKQLGSRTNYLKDHVDALEANSIRHSGTKNINADVTLTNLDYGKLIKVVGNSAPVTITLPTSLSSKDGDTLPIVNKSSFVVTILRQGTDLVDGQTSFVLNSLNDSFKLVLDKVNTNFTVSESKLTSNAVFLTSENDSSVSVSSTSYIQLSSISITTPNTGGTKNYSIDFKGNVIPSNAAADAELQFELRAGSTVLDTLTIGKQYSGFTGTISCVAILRKITAVAQNTVVSVYVRKIGGDCSISFSKLNLLEIK